MESPKPPKRLIRRERLVIDPRYLIVPGPEDVVASYRPLTRDHPNSALIGEIAVSWAVIESQLDMSISALADTEPEITACITAQMMGHSPRCLTIKALAHWRWLPDVEKAAESLNNLLHEAVEYRNRAVHDVMYYESKSKKTFRKHAMSKKVLKYGIEEFDESGLLKAIQILHSRRQDCSKLVGLIQAQVYEYYDAPAPKP